MASSSRRPGVEGPFALHNMSSKQPVRSQLFLPGVESNHDDASMHTQSEEERLANDAGKSDSRIVPLTRAVQVRETKLGNASEGKVTKLSREKDRTRPLHSDGIDVTKRLDRISDRAKSHREESFNNLFSLLDVALLRQAFHKLERGKASGIDGQTVEQYEANLESNLSDLATRLHRQSYRPHPSLRKEIPKGNGKTRPLGIANVYLHYVLDLWFERDVKPRLNGEAGMVRYADDFICGFESEEDARRFQAVLKKRLGRYSLELAEDKTKLLRFGRFAERDIQRDVEGHSPGTFDFLGFTHYCGHSRSGRFKLKRKTATKKLRSKYADLKDWLRHNLTQPITDVWATLNSKLQGHSQYYAIHDNWLWLLKYREGVQRFAYRWICRRSQKGRISLRDYHRYLERNPLVSPTRLTDLIAKGRTMAATMHR